MASLLVISGAEIFPALLDDAHDDENGDGGGADGVQPHGDGQRFGNHVEFDLVYDFDIALVGQSREKGQAAEKAEDVQNLSDQTGHGIIQQVHAEVRTLTEGARRAQKNDPHEEVHGDLFGGGKREIGAVTDDHVDERDTGHYCQQECSKELRL